MGELLKTAAPLYIFVFCLFLFVLSVIGAFLRSPRFKGWAGEMQIRFACWLLLKKDTYHSYHDVTLPTEDGTTQIDHVIVSPFGVFCVETKNMGGAIYGGEHDRTWTQKIGRQTHKFQNPLRQNYKHTMTLASLLGLSNDEVFSVIAFVGGGKLKKERPQGVTIDWGCVGYIKSFRTELLNDVRIAEACRLLESNRLEPTWKTHQAHLAHVQEIVNQKKVEMHSSEVLSEASRDEHPRRSTIGSNSIQCPRCGQLLVERKTRKGPNAGLEFWGCSAFPKCRYTEKKGGKTRDELQPNK